MDYHEVIMASWSIEVSFCSESFYYQLSSWELNFPESLSLVGHKRKLCCEIGDEKKIKKNRISGFGILIFFCFNQFLSGIVLVCLCPYVIAILPT